MSLARTALFALLLCALAGCAGTGKYDFAMIGDQQYSPESEKEFPPLMADLDRADLAFVVHVGDFKAGTTMPCTDALYRERRQQFDASRHPFILTPGDNDWTDCHNKAAGGFDPVERLASLRSIFYPDNRSMGRRRITLRQQGGTFRENAMWSVGPVLYATLHVVGSDNNLGNEPRQSQEYKERHAANLAWLGEVFAAARREGSVAVGLFMQANPRFERRFPGGRVGALELMAPPRAESGFTGLIPALENEVVAWGKPVLLMHGDTHYFRLDKPMFHTGQKGGGDRGRQVMNFNRLEVQGYPESHWVRVTVDPASPGVFTVREEIVEVNRFRLPR